MELTKCGMPKLPRDPRCADCETGVIICKHRGECQKPAYIACPSCTRASCAEEGCLKLVCCIIEPRLQATPPELKTEPSVVISCVESVKTPPAIVPVSPLFFRAIGQLCLSQDKQLFCNNVPASSLQLPSIINAAVTKIASRKVEAASESGRSDHGEWS